LEGRSLGEEGAWTQAPLEQNVAFWLSCAQCGAISETTLNGILTCEVWSDCRNGGPIQQCLHDGGHDKQSGWVQRQLYWYLSRIENDRVANDRVANDRIKNPG
jgi:hypothetical protein